MLDRPVQWQAVGGGAAVAEVLQSWLGMLDLEDARAIADHYIDCLPLSAICLNKKDSLATHPIVG